MVYKVVKIGFKEVACPIKSNTYQYMSECVGGYFVEEVSVGGEI